MKEKKRMKEKKKRNEDKKKKESSLGPTLKNGENVFCNCYCFLILRCHSWPGYSRFLCCGTFLPGFPFFFLFLLFSSHSCKSLSLSPLTDWARVRGGFSGQTTFSSDGHIHPGLAHRRVEVTRCGKTTASSVFLSA